MGKNKDHLMDEAREMLSDAQGMIKDAVEMLRGTAAELQDASKEVRQEFEDQTREFRRQVESMRNQSSKEKKELAKEPAAEWKKTDPLKLLRVDVTGRSNFSILLKAAFKLLFRGKATFLFKKPIKL